MMTMRWLMMIIVTFMIMMMNDEDTCKVETIADQ